MSASAIGGGSVINTALGGIQKANDMLLGAADAIAQGMIDPADIIALSQAAQSAAMNMAAIKTEQEVTQQLLDILV